MADYYSVNCVTDLDDGNVSFTPNVHIGHFDRRVFFCRPRYQMGERGALMSDQSDASIRMLFST